MRKLLRDKRTYPALEMYHLIEASGMPVVTGNAINAAQHVWGYFKDRATESEIRRSENVLRKFALNQAGILSVNNMLLMLAR